MVGFHPMARPPLALRLAIMKKLTPLGLALTAVLLPLLPSFLAAQKAAPISSTRNLPIGTEAAAQASAETQAILQDRLQRNQVADIEAALALKSEAEAQLLLNSILSKARADTAIAESSARARQRLAEAGRTEAVQRESVDYLRRRLRGEVAATEAPESFRSRRVVPDTVTGTTVVRSSQPRYYEDNRRVVTYRTMNEVPPVLIASSRLNRVNVQQVSEVPYATELVKVKVAERPVEYVAPAAYAVSYSVDPNSQVTRDDILFVQGSTAFQDAYSYDLVQDLAMAISDPALANESFVIEGHASAEGDFHENLALSQARAERIVREIVAFGVSTSRLVPVGYGETEAIYPANTAEEQRGLDRRVAVYRLQPTATAAP